VAVPALVPEFVSACAIEVPDPAEPPVTPDETTVQANVAPLTPELNAIPDTCALQMVCDEGVSVSTGIGFTVSTTVVVFPTQEPAVGVIV
jgi:hypothetical protein